MCPREKFVCGLLVADRRAMNSFVNITVQSAVLNTSCGDELFVAKQFNGPAFLSWLFSRLRVLLYLSNPYEESFEFEDQVSDYQTEVSLHTIDAFYIFNSIEIFPFRTFKFLKKKLNYLNNKFEKSSRHI